MHPDVSAIKQALGIKKSIELEVTLGTNFTGDLTRYDVVITHNMIQDKYQSFWNELNQQKTPVWIIQGANFSSRLFEGQIPNQEFELVNRSPVAISGVLDSEFSLFEISNLNTDVLKRYPPLLGNLLEFSPSEDMDVLLHQQLGMVQTKNPLWFFTQRNGVKTSVLMGTGIWRWRMSEFKQNENFENYDHLISKTIQYLTVKEDKSQFRLQYEHSFTENEDVQIDAYVYNKALELVADQDVAIKVKNEEGKEFSYLFTPQSNKYSLKIPGLAPGQYSFVATCFFGQNQLTKQGAFTIKEIDVEFAQTKANHTLLQKISQNTQAKFYPYSERELLLNELKTPERFPATLYANTENNPLISLFWITGLILILLALEWILRKMWGQV